MPDLFHTHVLSYLQLEQLDVGGIDGKESISLSTDLGISTREVGIDERGIHFAAEVLLAWEDVKKITGDRQCCYEVDEQGVRPIRGFSSVTNRAVSLVPTQSAPALMLGGFLMHRVKGTDPFTAARLMVQAAMPTGGRVLDTTTGLGYAAIEAAKRAGSVTTIERDPAVAEIARRNPWSRPLFADHRITPILGDSVEEVTKFDSETFSRIVHDPPTLNVAGELYATEFYRQLLRVLTRNGRLFHYIGDPTSGSGAKTTASVTRRLVDAGFQKVKPAPGAHGVVAFKP